MNFVKYDPSTDLFSFNFLHSDNLMDLTKKELDEYNNQKFLWELDDAESEELCGLFDDAKFTSLAREAVYTIYSKSSWDQECEDLFDSFASQNALLYIVKEMQQQQTAAMNFMRMTQFPLPQFHCDEKG